VIPAQSKLPKVSLRQLIASFAAVFAVVFGMLPAVSAQEAEAPPQLVAHRVDARNDTTEVIAISTDYSASTVSLEENGELVEGQLATLGSISMQNEVVFVIDTSRRLRNNDALGQFKTALAAEILQLPTGTSVGVVDAASSAIIVAPLTSDRNAAAAAVEKIEFSEGGRVIDGVDKAVAMLSEPEVPGIATVAQSVIVFSGGVDVASKASVGASQGGLIRRGAQLITLDFNGGESSFDAVVEASGGLGFDIASSDDIARSVTAAVDAASDRYVVRFVGQNAEDTRGDLAISIAGATDSVSYPGGELTIRSLALTPSAQDQTTSAFGFFETKTGFYVTMLMAFLGIGLAIYMLGSIFATGDSALDGLIARYSTGDEELAVEDSNMVQTALVQRAVEMSESFAEERGFLLKIEELLERAKLPLRPGEAMSFYLASIVLGMGFGFFLLGGLLGSVLIGFLVAIILLFVVRFMAKRRMRKFEQQLPDTLQLLAGTLRAGYSLPQGFEAVSKESADPMGYELTRVMTEARLGRELEEALAAAAERLSSPDFAWAVMAISIQREVGGNLNELLMTVSDTMVQRERLKGEIATLTAEGKMSAILLGGLPPGLGFVMWIMNPEYINQLFVEFLGNVFLGMGIVSSIIGLVWMKKVITIDV